MFRMKNNSNNHCHQPKRKQPIHYFQRKNAALIYGRSSIPTAPYSEQDELSSGVKGRCRSCVALPYLLLIGLYPSTDEFALHRWFVVFITYFIFRFQSACPPFWIRFQWMFPPWWIIILDFDWNVFMKNLKFGIFQHLGCLIFAVKKGCLNLMRNIIFFLLK